MAPEDLLRLAESVRAAGPAAPVAFVALYAACTLLPLPRNVLSAAAGTLFGWGWGIPLAYLGSLLGAGAAFWLARAQGRSRWSRSSKALSGSRRASFDAALEKRGLLTVLGARVLPVVPFTAFNYAAGLTGIRRRDYVVGTVLGVVPGTVAYVTAGAYAARPAAWSLEVTGAMLLLLGVAAAVHVVLRREPEEEPRRHKRTGGAQRGMLGLGHLGDPTLRRRRLSMSNPRSRSRPSVG
ncbi:MAG TPA: TVP38/TMEM64 family protein [Propionicimonas sp.]|nr:TVP38/TMEM64 family protein [Propionicimonas sp.]